MKFKKSLLLTLGLTGSSVLMAGAREHPNVILIITDDQGYGDLGITGNPNIRTPNIDRFAKESARFTNFYVSPVSAPTRSSLMTGRYSLRTGVRDTYNGGAIMASSEITMAEMLKEQGYVTGIFGKWHLGDNHPSRPMDQGFDESLIHLTGGMAQPGDITTYLRGDSAYFDPVLWHNGRQEKYEGYCSDVFAGQAAAFLEKNRSRPFFCYLAFNAPHTPLQVPDNYYNMYRDTDPSAGFPEELRKSMTDKDREDARKVYAMVTNVDDNVGMLLRKLDELGLSGNTVVIFMTDNGPQQRRYVGGMRGLKGSVYNGGVRVPFFMRYPAMNIGDRDVATTSAHIDVLPTIAGLCNAALPTDRKIDGRSLLPLINREIAGDDRPLFFYWTRRNPEKYINIALMKGHFRFVGQADHDAQPEEFQLYDISSDPGEQVNIIEDKPMLAMKMKRTLDSMLLDLSGSENMANPQFISVGTIHENPVILNRNDAWGERGIWEQEEIYGIWNVDISEGSYDIKFRFKNPVPPNGRMVIDLSALTLQQRYPAGNVVELEMKNVRLPGGKCEFSSFYEAGGKRIMPLWVEISKTRGSPYPQSKLIKSMQIDWSTHQRHAMGSDNFQLTWSDDDHQYGLWGDGEGFAAKPGYRVSMGVARVEGDFDNYRGYDRYGHRESSEHEAQVVGKGWGTISVKGSLYAWIHPDKPGGWGNWAWHHKESRLYKSTDKGASWEAAEWAFTPEDGLIGGAILQFGKDYAGSRDRFVYHYLVQPSIQYDTAGNATELQVPGLIYLMRVRSDRIMDRKAYEFYAGTDGKDVAWSRIPADRQPVFKDDNGVGTPIGISYNSGLKRYILTTEHLKAHAGMTGVFEAPEPWGPWSTVTYLTDDDWFGFDNSDIVPRNCFFWSFPAKWISRDGTEATMVFTGGGRGKNNDSFNTVRVKFMTGQ